MTPTSESSATTNSPFLVRTITTPTVEAEVETKAPSAKAEKVDVVPQNGEIPIDLYEERRGRPYVADIFDMSSTYGKSGFEAELKVIDKYVLDQISSQQLKLTQQSYTEVLTKLESDIGMSDNLRGDARATQLAKYISIVNMESDLEKQRKALLSGI